MVAQFHQRHHLELDEEKHEGCARDEDIKSHIFISRSPQGKAKNNNLPHDYKYSNVSILAIPKKKVCVTFYKLFACASAESNVIVFLIVGYDWPGVIQNKVALLLIRL